MSTTSETELYSMLSTMNSLFFPNETRTMYTGNMIGSNSVPLPTSTWNWNTFFDSNLFRAKFDASIICPSATQFNAFYTTKSSSNIYISAKGVAGLASLNAASQDLTNPITSLNYSPMLRTSTGSYTLLGALLHDITCLLNYDYSTFNSQRVKGYVLAAPTSTTTTTQTLVTMNLSLVSQANRYATYLANITEINYDSEIKQRVNFFAFRRLLLLAKLAIHYQIGLIIGKRIETVAPIDLVMSSRMSMIPLGIMNRIIDSFDDSTSDDANYNDFQEQTQNLTVKYYNNLSSMKATNREFEIVKKDVGQKMMNQASSTTMNNYTLALKIVAIIVTVLAVGLLAFSFTPANKMGSRFSVSFQVFLLSVIVSLGFYFTTSYYSMEPFAVMPINSTQSTSGQYSTASQLTALQTNISYNSSVFLDCIAKYLQQTYKGATIIQTSQIFTASTSIQANDLYNMQLYTDNLKIASGEMESANKIIEAKQRNNVAVAWLLLGLLMIGSTTLMAHNLFSTAALFQVIADAAGASIAILYALMMLFLIYSRTRRDPAKFYWKQPNMVSYQNLA